MPTISKRKQADSVVEVTISNRTIVRLAVVVVLILAMLWGVDRARHALLLIFFSFFLALALNGPVQWIARHLPGRLRGKRSLGTTISYLVVVIIIGAFVAYVGPPLVRQTENFIHDTPHIVSEFRNQSGAIGKFIRHYHLQKEVNNVSSQLSSRVHSISGKALPAVVSVGRDIFSLVAVVVLTFMMLVEGPRWITALRRIMPSDRHDLADRLANDMYGVIRGYVNGQVVLAAIAAAFLTPALLIAGVSYPVALIVVVFVCGLIPMVGHSIGAIIVTIVALFHSLASGIGILAYYILYMQLESYLIQPKIQANTTKMSPLLVFASLIIGISFGGIFGGLIAIPVTGCIRVVVLELLRTRKVISDPQFEQAVHHPSSATEDQ